MSFGKEGLKKMTYLVLGIAILFEVLSAMVPTAQSAGDALNASGVPLGTLFAGGGVVFLVIMAGVLYKVFNTAM